MSNDFRRTIVAPSTLRARGSDRCGSSARHSPRRFPRFDHNRQKCCGVERLLDDRTAAKAQKDYANADAARDALVHMGIEVRATPEGVEWSVA